MKPLSSHEKLELLSKLTAEHQALKARVRELESHVSLTSQERIEMSELKKKKLWTKDRIQLLQRN